MTTKEVANEVLNMMFSEYENTEKIICYNFDTLVQNFPSISKDKLTNAIWTLEQDGFLSVWGGDNVPYTSSLTYDAISYLEDCDRDMNGKRITSYAGSRQNTSPVVINIGTANNSIIGNQQNANINIASSFEEVTRLINEVPDEDEKEVLLELLENVKAKNDITEKGFKKIVRMIPEWISQKYPAIIDVLLKTVQLVHGITG